MKHLLENENIVVLSDGWYDIDCWVSFHYLSTIISKANRVLFVESAPIFFIALLHPKKWKNWKRWLKGIRKKSNNLYVYSPPPKLPFDNRFLLISRLNQLWLRFWLNRAIRKLKFENSILWVTNLRAKYIIGHLGEKFSCFHSKDEQLAFNRPFDKREVVSNDEENTARKADVVIVTAEKLVEKFKKINPKVFIVSHGVSLEQYSSFTKIPDDLARVRKPIIGFIGKIETWLDFELIKDIALKMPECSFVFVGPLNCDIAQLDNIANISFLGLKPKQMVPSYIQAFDVCWIPFKMNELTQSVNPLKLYEYMAGCKAVVSADLPEVRKYKDYISVAQSKADFENYIKEALRQDDQDFRGKYSELLKSISWQHKALEFEEILLQNMRSKIVEKK